MISADALSIETPKPYLCSYVYPGLRYCHKEAGFEIATTDGTVVGRRCQEHAGWRYVRGDFVISALPSADTEQKS